MPCLAQYLILTGAQTQVYLAVKLQNLNSDEYAQSTKTGELQMFSIKNNVFFEFLNLSEDFSQMRIFPLFFSIFHLLQCNLETKQCYQGL